MVHGNRHAGLLGSGLALEANWTAQRSVMTSIVALIHSLTIGVWF